MVGLVKELQNIQKDIQERLDANKGNDPLFGQWLAGVNNGLSIAINRLIGDEEWKEDK